jgi:hypothetical protein
VHFTVLAGPTDYTKAVSSPYLANDYPASPDPYTCGMQLTQGDLSVLASVSDGDTNCGPAFWVNTYGAAGFDTAQSVTVAADGSFIFAGISSSFGGKRNTNRYLWIVKLHKNGTIAWQKTCAIAASTNGGEGAYQIIQTTDGGHIVTIGPSAMLVKIDATGNLLWTKSFPEPASATSIFSLIPASDGGGYIGAGVDYAYNDGAAWVFKFDDSGNIVWNHRYGIGTDAVEAFDIKPTASGYLVVGYDAPYCVSQCNVYAWQFTIDDSGVLQSSGALYGTNVSVSPAASTSATAVAPTSDGGYVVGGGTNTAGTGAWLLKVDSSDNTVWEYTSASPANLRVLEVQPAETGYSLVLFSDGTNITLAKVDASGAIVWQRSFANFMVDSGNDEHALVATNDGAYLLVGSTISSTNTDAEVIKIDTNGNVGSTCSSLVNGTVILNSTLLGSTAPSAFGVDIALGGVAGTFSSGVTTTAGGTTVCTG